MALNNNLKYFGKPEIEFEDWLNLGEGSAPEALRALGVKGTDDELQEIYKRYFNGVVNGYGIRPHVYSDAKRVFERLHKMDKKIVVLSSHPTENVIKEEPKKDQSPKNIGSSFEQIILDRKSVV